MNTLSQTQFIRQLPKAELHVHLEGTLEPELMLKIAQRNKVTLPFATLNEIRTSRVFQDYESFWHSYQMATQVMHTQQDFYDVTYAYLQKVSSQGVCHVEITFDLDTYLPRKINPEIIINGIYQALQDGKKQYDISGFMILCFLRHLPIETSLETFKKALPYKDKIKSIGLASFEEGNPPSKFTPLFQLAREHGFFTTAHSGEHAGPEYIWQTINELKVDRIDHGVRCMEDPELVKVLCEKQIPLTVCPLSNVQLGVFKNLTQHPIKKMLDAGLNVSINSDDPAFFGGYIFDNYVAAYQHAELSLEDLIKCAQNSYNGSFLGPEEKKWYIQKMSNYIQINSNS